MRRVCLSAALALITFGAVVLLALVPAVSVAVRLAATALIMGGAGHPLSIPQDTPGYIGGFVASATDKYVTPSGLCIGGDPGCTAIAVYTPEQVRFDTGLWDMTLDESVAVGRANLDACLRGQACTVTRSPFTTTGPPEVLTDSSFVVYGYSQSAIIATIQKYQLIAHPSGGTVSFILVANPNRPNGGIMERFVGAYLPLIGITFSGSTPTNSPQPTPLTTVDVTNQYDPMADFPTNPLNLLADLNLLLGAVYLHPEGAYFDTAKTPQLQGQYEDTTYYLVPSPTLPLLMPLTGIPLVGPALAATLDAPLRVLVEAGYDRSINPGRPTPAQFLYIPDPVALVCNFLLAIPTGWDDGIATLTGNPANRPFHTAPQPTYGVGGRPVYTGAVDPYGPPTPYAAGPEPAPADVPAAEESAPAARKVTGGSEKDAMEDAVEAAAEESPADEPAQTTEAEPAEQAVADPPDDEQQAPTPASPAPEAPDVEAAASEPAAA